MNVIIVESTHRLFCRSTIWVGVWLHLAAAVVAQESKPAVPDYTRDVRPILSRCMACHGPDEAARQADLRLDQFASATADLGGYRAIVPGDSAASESIVRIMESDVDLVMPPATHGPRLTDDEVSVLKAWIDSGAEYSVHWAYIAPVKSPVRSLQKNNWCRNELDRFALHRMTENGLAPNDEATKSELLRRVTLDLTGLPPTAEQLADFQNDPRPDAWEKVVDRLLNDPAYGERWASIWLDLARYADSQGYSSDDIRTIWPYRDYVIRSLNDNKPFDQFTVEQIAGDLLPNADQDSIVATAFHRNTLTNTEGGTDDEEFRNAAIIDRVNTTFSVWMGTTMACAQCHTHKYDPITQAEYFQFFDIFNQTADRDLADETPVLELYPEADRARMANMDAEIKRLKRITEAIESEDTEVLQWLNKQLAGTENRIPVPAVRFLRIELPGKEKILSLAEVEVFSNGENIARNGVASQSSVNHQGPADLAIDGNTNGDYLNAKSVTHTNKESNPWWELDLAKLSPIDSFAIWNRTDHNLHHRLDGVRVKLLDDNRTVVWSGQFARATMESMTRSVGEVPASVGAILAKPESTRSAEETATVASFAKSAFQSMDSNVLRLSDLADQRNSIAFYATVPVLKELPADKRRETKIQIRGSFLNTGEKVSAGTPAVFHRIPEGQTLDRMAIAKWLVDRKNPLTARVLVNRFWEQMFGTGLVATSEEFGSQGEFPSHPELLDWLAVELMDSGWNCKHVLKLIAMSATYRQSSVTTPEKIRIDQFNRYLARGPRVRLTAEMVRDQALAVSGLLSRQMYGPPVHPPKPKLGLKSAFRSETTDWQTSEGTDRYRRGVYTELRRSMPYPALSTFDCPNREVTELRRIPTNTPLQALVTLNDPVFVEAAQALARKMVSQAIDQSPEEIAGYGFRSCLLRVPAEVELATLTDVFETTLETFANQPEAAIALATDPLGPLPDGADPASYAAWTTVANILLNLDEMIQKR